MIGLRHVTAVFAPIFFALVFFALAPLAVEAAPLKCGTNYKKINGQCVLQQNCGANAYRSPEGDCYCKTNYQMKNGKCVWKTNKYGFEIAPWKKSGCKTWASQCKRGNANACGKHEANCQVN